MTGLLFIVLLVAAVLSCFVLYDNDQPRPFDWERD